MVAAGARRRSIALAALAALTWAWCGAAQQSAPPAAPTVDAAPFAPAKQGDGVVEEDLSAPGA